MAAQQQQQGHGMQDLARQALAATGGKSTLKATKWLLERRAGVPQQQPPQSPPLQEANISELGLQRKGSINSSVKNGIGEDGLHKKVLGEDELGSMLPSSPTLWGNNSNGLHPGGGGSVAVVTPAADHQRPTMAMAEKRLNSPGSMDWLGSSSTAVERHPSIGSSSPVPKEDTSAQLQLKLQPIFESQQSIKASKVSLSPEPEETTKIASPKLVAHPAVSIATGCAVHDANNLKRKRQDEPDIATNVKPFLVLPSCPSPIAMGLKQQTSPTGKALASLAERMRPNSLAEILGQDHLLGPHCILWSLLDVDSLPCIIFGGPPGTGKTSLARLIAQSASCRYVSLSSTKGGSVDIQEILDEAKQAWKFGQRTVLFVETLNRFSKFQQECLLPAIKEGFVVLIGATTGNPSAELIPSLLVRCMIFMLRKLQPDHLCMAMKLSVSDRERGLLVSLEDDSNIEHLVVEDDAIEFVATAADGDARVALNALEAAVCIAIGKHRRKTEMDGKLTAAPEAVDNSEKETAAWEKVTGNLKTAKKDAQYNVLEHLKGYFQFSQEEYAKPFKKLVGGKEVTFGISKDREAQKPSSDADMEGIVALREGKERHLADRKIGGGDFVTKSITQAEVETILVVTLLDAKEAFQWPQVAIKKAQEVSDMDLMSALQKSIRGGDSNASVYWLARVFETSEEPLKIASSLMKFASEEIGMADPQALVQAAACYQACKLLGMKDCSSNLTQCVVYLSMAPKSDAVGQAFHLAQKAVQDGQNEPVPAHLRSAGGSLKDLGYLPISLRNSTFFKWPEF